MRWNDQYDKPSLFQRDFLEKRGCLETFNMKKKVVIAGNIILDIVKMIDVWPERGMLANVVEINRAVGGCVCNTGIDLKTMDKEVTVCAYGKVGEDEYGQWLLEFMKDKGVDVTNVKKTGGRCTASTDVMTVRSTGERTFFHVGGADEIFSYNDIDIDALDCDLFHLGYLLLLNSLDEECPEYGTKAAKLLHDVQEKGIKTSIDLVSDQNGRFAKLVPPALKYCNYIVINEIEGGMLSGISSRETNGALNFENLEMICRKIMEMGVQDAVVIHSPEMSCSLDSKGVFTVLPSLSLPDGYIVGAVGAGDAFCAGMLYAFINDMDMSQGMRIASCSAACNLAARDSVGGAKSLEEILKIEKQYKRRILNVNQKTV